MEKPEEKIIPFKWGFALIGVFLFMALIALVGPYSAHIDFIEDTSGAWYYWKLPDPNQWAFATAWIGYIAHQIGNWWIIAKAKKKRGRYIKGLRPLNVFALIFNGVFIVLHVVQTRIWYDGLAQSFSPYVAQFSVIFLLVIVLLLENPRRGMFFGKKAPIKAQIIDFLKRYHGYYFSWAIVFTFWFHPMETNWGHLMGFFYMFLLMLQGSLFFTAFHLERRWTTLLEVFVLFHAVVVAYLSPLQSANMVAMFGFGFLTLFVVTQIYGLNLSKKIIVAVTLIYLILVFSFYAGNISDMTTVLRIPVAEYGIAFTIALLVWAILLIGKGFKKLTDKGVGK